MKINFNGTGGKINFNGTNGVIHFGDPQVMATPTVTLQWIYDSTDQKYKGKATVTNNDSYTATIGFDIMYLGEDIPMSSITLGPGATSSPIYVSNSTVAISPENDQEFSVIAWASDPNGIKQTSEDTRKETTASFRTYIYNIGIGGMQGLSQGYTFGNATTYSTTPTINYLEVTAQSTSLYQESKNAVRTTATYNMSTDNLMIFEYTAQGSTDMDKFTFARASNWNQDAEAISSFDKIVKVFSSSWTDGRVSLNFSQGSNYYYIMQITSIDQPFSSNQVRIKKIYIESKANGPIV